MCDAFCVTLSYKGTFLPRGNASERGTSDTTAPTRPHRVPRNPCKRGEVEGGEDDTEKRSRTNEKGAAAAFILWWTHGRKTWATAAERVRCGRGVERDKEDKSKRDEGWEGMRQWQKVADNIGEEMMTCVHWGQSFTCFKSPLNGNRWQREWEWQQESRRDIWRASRRGPSVTREGLLWNRSLLSYALLSSPLRLSTYLLRHQSVRPLQHLSPAAFLRPVSRSHFTADRLMPLH